MREFEGVRQSPDKAIAAARAAARHLPAAKSG